MIKTLMMEKTTEKNTDGEVFFHYTDISHNYDKMYSPIHQAYIPTIIRKLELKPSDVVIDIGGGTGRVGHLLWSKAGLKEPVTSVDPCSAFHQQASQLPGVKSVHATAEEFFSNHSTKNTENDEQVPFDKVLMFMSAHHFKNRKNVFHDMLQCLSPLASCLILVRGKTQILPFPTFILEDFTAIFKDDVPQILADLEEFNASVEVSKEDQQYCLPKVDWYNMIRGRFFSNFQRYSDERLEEGIAELEQTVYKGVKDEDLIKIDDQFIAILISKR